MKPPKPSTYNNVGSDPEALESWLDQMDSYFVLAETPETELNERVLTASFYLAGGALDWYKSDKANLTSWNVFKERITNYFVPPNYRITLVQKWDNLAWQKGQSVSQYSTEIKILALKLKKSAEDQIHKLVFKGNPRLITQLVTQMGAATNYESVVRVALNLEQAISIADAAQPRRQFVPRGPPTSNVGTWRTPSTAPVPAPESKQRAATPGRFSESQPSISTVHVPDPVPYGLSRWEYIRLKEMKACFYCKQENVELGHNWKTCPKRQVDHERRMIKQEVNFINEAEVEPATMYEIEHSDSYSVPPITVSAMLDNHPVQGPADSGATSNFISPQTVQQAKLRTRPITAPSLLHQALSKVPVRISEQLIAKIDGVKTKKPTIFKVAPLASHDVIFGMPFLKENELLIDPVA